MRACFEGLRRHILQSVISRQDIYDVADRYQVYVRTVWSYLRQHRERGNPCAPKVRRP